MKRAILVVGIGLAIYVVLLLSILCAVHLGGVAIHGDSLTGIIISCVFVALIISAVIADMAK